MLVHFFKAVVGIMISFHSYAYDGEGVSPGETLINYFGQTCKSLGSFTNSALNDSRALISTLETLRDDENCKSVSGAISKLNNLQNKLSALDDEYYEQMEYAKLEAQEIEVLSQLANTTDPLKVQDLQAVLAQIQLDKATEMGRIDLRQSYDGDKLRNTYGQLINTTSAAYEAVTSNQLCIDSNPQVLLAATSMATSIAASSMLINPALGLGLATLSDFIGDTLDYYRHRGYNAGIKYISNRSSVMVGLKCAIETLANRQCDIVDAKKFLEIENRLKREKNNFSTNSDLSKIKAISELFDIDIPVLIEWLEKVKAGAPAASRADALRKNSVYKDIADLQSSRAYGEGIFSEKEPFFNNAQGKQEKISIIREVIESLMFASGNYLSSGISDGSSSSGRDNPLYLIHKKDYAPYYLLGLSRDQVTTDQDGNIKRFSIINIESEYPNYSPNLNQIENLYFEWILEAQERVNRMSALILQPVPVIIVSDFADKSSSSYKRSPKESLLNVINFLKENTPNPSHPNRKELFDSTEEILSKIYEIIPKDTPPRLSSAQSSSCENLLNINELLSSPDISLSVCNPYLDVIEKVSRIAQLEFGSLIIKNRLETSLRVAVGEYIEQTDVTAENENQLAQLLAADSYLDVLKQVTGKDDPSEILDDLNNSIIVSQENLKSFSRTFRYKINYLFRIEQKYITSDEPSISKPRLKERARLCFLLASIYEFPMSSFFKYCDGVTYQEVEGGPSAPIFDYDFIKGPYEKRRCQFRDYQRKLRIYEQWGIKL